MSLDAHLIHTCTIENPAAGSTNAYNNALKGFAAPLTDVRCRLVEDNEFVKVDEVTEGFVKTVYKLMVRGDVDLQEKARISSVTLEDGTVISDVFEVANLLVRRGRNAHHKTATLERIS
jgi:hypothetical protein